MPTVTKALALLRGGHAPCLAILDINLQGEMAWPVADLLREMDIPFLFATGYDVKAIPPAYADVPLAEKPVSLRHLGSAKRG